MMTTRNLDSIGELIQAHFEMKNQAREAAIALSRTLIRQCANTIRAVHRREWGEAQRRMAEAEQSARQMRGLLSEHPDLYYAGYTQDALKEYVEAHLTYTLIRNEDLPLPEALDVPPDTYVNGLAEASTELRRHILDMIRQGDHDEAERMLDAMDQIYTLLITYDYPDAITGGLRRRTDTVRSVLEKTRGDLTMSLRQQKLQNALQALSDQLHLQDKEPFYSKEPPLESEE